MDVGWLQVSIVWRFFGAGTLRGSRMKGSFVLLYVGSVPIAELRAGGLPCAVNSVSLIFPHKPGDSHPGVSLESFLKFYKKSSFRP